MGLRVLGLGLLGKPVQLGDGSEEVATAVEIHSQDVREHPALLQLLPANGPKYGGLWWVMMFHGAFVAGLGVLAWILVGSMTADVVEDSQRQTGRRSEGLFFAGPALIQKSISDLGDIIKGSILTVVGFSTAVTDTE